MTNEKKKKKLSREKNVVSEEASDGLSSEDPSDVDTKNTTNPKMTGSSKLLPEETPGWGIKLLEIIQGEFRSILDQMKSVQQTNQSHTESIATLETKVKRIEKRNEELVAENCALKERLLDVAYRQRRDNLIFEGIQDAPNEADADTIRKLRFSVHGIPGVDAENFKVDRCHRLDGQYRQDSTRRVICCFNWYNDIQCILRNCKLLPRGVYVSEDYPEEWNDRRKILRPIFNAAKRSESLKHKTHMSKDRLYIDGKVFTAAPKCNILEANTLVDVPGTCQRNDDSKVIFLGMHSVFSNLHPCNFTVNNIQYNCAEQYIQSQKSIPL